MLEKKFLMFKVTSTRSCCRLAMIPCGFRPSKVPFNLQILVKGFGVASTIAMMNEWVCSFESFLVIPLELTDLVYCVYEEIYIWCLPWNSDQIPECTQTTKYVENCMDDYYISPEYEQLLWKQYNWKCHPINDSFIFQDLITKKDFFFHSILNRQIDHMNLIKRKTLQHHFPRVCLLTEVSVKFRFRFQ